MTQWGGPTLLALFAGFGLAFVLVVPYVAISYRRRGEFGVGRAVAGVAFLVYCFALVTYTLVPLPDLSAAYCATHTSLRHPVWNPLQFLSDMRQFDTGLLDNPALRQVLFNVALFVPWGVFARRFLGWGAAAAIVGGFGVSLSIELTQLTGVWFLLPCPYRLFDTGDLVANTLGAAVGVLLAPVLWRASRDRRDADEPRPVRTGRRLLGMALDLVGVTVLGAALLVCVRAVEYLGDPARLTGPGRPLLDATLGSWLPAVVALLVVPLAGNGATIGQRAVLLTVVGQDGGKPSALASVVRFLVGSGGYFLLAGLATATGHPSALSAWWLAANLVFVFFTRAHRGLTGLVAGLSVTDSRPARTTTSV
ncbi:VanZ family protein [Amycolatopsis sp. PS_44_ISF1]|uniref:VanZ family protein n=1 Tax=Amycolatopsis sp. PS_44_ISF1 TaxID=2974917 RepID=UPI0028DD74AD|nr:VanZ family protein [Amycolatopsis sp. PS_44_ISF1]MDT8911828.1 VanZ family protein [Amycolatopsis sp. PS_44_ISF1]